MCVVALRLYRVRSFILSRRCKLRKKRKSCSALYRRRRLAAPIYWYVLTYLVRCPWCLYIADICLGIPISDQDAVVYCILYVPRGRAPQYPAIGMSLAPSDLRQGCQCPWSVTTCSPASRLGSGVDLWEVSYRLMKRPLYFVSRFATQQ